MKRSAIVTALLFVASAATAQTPVRMAWQEFAKDPKRVASFRKAVATMKSMSTADPSSAAYRGSWEYWGAMHGFFGTMSPSGTKAAWMAKYGYPPSSRYWVGVKDLTPPDAIARAVWAQCQHSTPTAIAQYFFPWHRLYLFYFERVLQKAAGDATLRLPYWDYTDPANVAMPKEFTTPTYVDENGKTVSNPLYEARRAPGWSGGSTLDPTITNINSTLNNPDLLGDVGFQYAIERRPHGDVHCAVAPCKNAVMGAVPYSSNDPIFWLHHCNIDRIWDCWRSISGHLDPSGDYLKQQFSYVDENGNQVTKSVGDLFNGSLIDYVYDHPKDCARPQAAPLVAAVSRPLLTASTLDTARMKLAKPVLLGSAKGVAIHALTTRKSIALPENEQTRAPKTMALNAPKALPVVTELVLKNIQFNLPPDTLFKVYLESKSNPKKRVFVGTLNFFNSPEDHEGAPDQVFDVTDILPAFGAGGKLDAVTVVFEASTGRVGAKEAPTLNPKSNLVVGEVDFVMKLR